MQARYAGSVIITEEQIDTALTRLEDGADRAQFLVSEIFLSVDQPEDEEDVRVVAAQIFQQLNFGAVFPQVARQFSQSPSAAGGGNIGWVQQGQLSEMIDAALTQMQPGELAAPIRPAAPRRAALDCAPQVADASGAKHLGQAAEAIADEEVRPRSFDWPGGIELCITSRQVEMKPGG